MMHLHDRHGRSVVCEWYETGLGRLALTVGWVLLLGLCVAWACDVMPVRYARPSVVTPRGQH